MSHRAAALEQLGDPLRHAAGDRAEPACRRDADIAGVPTRSFDLAERGRVVVADLD
jgi:hypothetical protein